MAFYPEDGGERTILSPYQLVESKATRIHGQAALHVGGTVLLRWVHGSNKSKAPEILFAYERHHRYRCAVGWLCTSTFSRPPPLPPPSCAHAYMPACQADLVWGHRYTMWFQTASRAGGSESRSAICNQLDAMELAAFLSSRKVKPIGACAPRCLFLSNASTPGKRWR